MGALRDPVSWSVIPADTCTDDGYGLAGVFVLPETLSPCGSATAARCTADRQNA